MTSTISAARPRRMMLHTCVQCGWRRSRGPLTKREKSYARALADKLHPGRHLRDEAVLPRPPRARPAATGRRPAGGRGRRAVRRPPHHALALATAPRTRRRGGPARPPRPDAGDPAGAAAGAVGPGGRAAGRHARRALRGLGDGDRHDGERVDDVPRPAPARLAAQKKTPSAIERDNEARAAWREDAASLAPEMLVFLDETSTHTALTRRRARAPRGHGHTGAFPATTAPT